jgi:hypothetical protein
MRRLVVCVFAAVLAAASVYAVDPDRADGSLTTGAGTVTLAYAYAMDRSHNDLDNRKDALKIILTDKPLPAGTNLADVDYNFPDGILGIVVCLDKNNQPMHLVVQHQQGVYDAGWVEVNHDVRTRAKRANGTVEGRLTAKRVEAPSVTFSFDAEFAATVQ